jgi:hypothetical protein
LVGRNFIPDAGPAKSLKTKAQVFFGIRGLHQTFSYVYLGDAWLVSALETA